MKKLLLLPLLATAIALPCAAQTLKISHKSHAGMSATFSTDAVDYFGWSYEMEQERLKAVERAAKEAKEKEKLEKEKGKGQTETHQEQNQSGQAPETPTTPQEDAPLSDPPADAPAEENMTPTPDQVPASPQQPAKGKKGKRGGKARSSHAAADSGMDEDNSEVEPRAVLTAHQAASRRHEGWLYGLIGLTVVPTLVFASGVFGRKREQDQA